jgi:WD40 repeat protein
MPPQKKKHRGDAVRVTRSATAGTNANANPDSASREVVSIRHPGVVPASVSWSADGSRIVSRCQGGTSGYLWDAVTGRRISKLGASLPRSVTGAHPCVSWSPNGARAIFWTSGNGVRVWGKTAGVCLSTLRGFASARVKSALWSPGGDFVSSVIGAGKELAVWDVTTGRRSPAFGCILGVGCVSWRPDGASVAFGSVDGHVCVVDAVTGWVFPLYGHSGVVNSVSWSPDCTRIASGSVDGSVCVLDAATGQCLSTLSGHSHAITPLSWSPDSTRIASGSWDTVRVWDAATGQCLSTLNGHSDLVHSISWAPDGTRIASGSWDKIIKVWDVSGFGARDKPHQSGGCCLF